MFTLQNRIAVYSTFPITTFNTLYWAFIGHREKFLPIYLVPTNNRITWIDIYSTSTHAFYKEI